VDNRNGDVVLLNQLLDYLINFDVFSVVEFNWSLGEKNVALFVNLGVGDTSILGLTEDEVLIESVLIDLLLLDSSDHLLFLGLEVTQLGHQLDLLVVVDLDQSLLFLLLQSSSLIDLVIFLLHHPAVSFSLGPQVVLSSLPEVLLLLLGNDVEASALRLNHQLVLLHHDVVVLLLGSLHGLHVWRATGAALGNQLLNLAGVKPQFGLLEQAEVGDGHRHGSREAGGTVNVHSVLLLKQVVQGLACVVILLTVGLQIVIFD